jgi:hypothetical protein
MGWHGTLHQFDILSLNFALAFMVANERKLVNLSPEAMELLASSGHVPNPRAPRSPRRHMN